MATSVQHNPQATALLIVGHGSRVPASNDQFETVVAMTAAKLPEVEVRFGYLELAEPYFGDALRQLAEAGHRQIKIIPYLLFMAGHAKNDFPLAVAELQQDYPELEVTFTNPLGGDDRLHRRLAQRLSSDDPERSSTAKAKDSAKQKDRCLVVVGRGASDPGANSGFYKAARIIGEYAGIKEVYPCFVGITEPLLPDMLAKVVRLRPEQITILPFFLFTGILLERINKQVAEIKDRSPWVNIDSLGPIGVHDDVVTALVDKALHETSAELDSCLTCPYRPDPAKVKSETDGLSALLWSLRHSFTHNQAMPHDHAHPPLKKHVLVCGNADCVDKGGLKVLGKLRRVLRKAKKMTEIKVTRVSCLGRCGEGPTVVVYPDGIWYREFTEEYCQQLVDDHLSGDKLVAAKVDNIMS